MILNKGTRKDLTQKVEFEQRLEGLKAMSPSTTLAKSMEVERRAHAKALRQEGGWSVNRGARGLSTGAVEDSIGS